MQQPFLSVLFALKNKQPPMPTKGLWLVHSDEALTQQWLIDALKPYWQKNEQTPKRLELQSSKSWQEVINELSSFGLFDTGTALIVTSEHKPDNKIIQKLNHFFEDVQNATCHHHLLWCAPKQDKKSLNSQAVKFFDRFGLVIDANVANEQIRANILKVKADELHLTLDQEAWQILLTHTEHNLLAAFQTLWRLSYLDTRAINPQQLSQALVEGSQFDIFALLNHLLAGNAQKSLKILQYLQHSKVAPSLVLWLIGKEARLLCQLQAGKDPQSLGIWSNKVFIYQQALARNQHLSHHWLKQIYQADKTIKGLSTDDIWQQLRQLVLSLCGIYPQNLTTHQTK